MVSSDDDRIRRTAQKVRDRGVRLGPPLSEEELRRFEDRHGISLPADYRSFLLHIGNGGEGPPEYGIAALGGSADDMRGEEVRLWSELPTVRERFPFTKPWVWEDGELSDEGTKDQISNGCIYVGNDGCGMYWYVIVTGPERANMWMICGEGMEPTEPKRDFLRWYEDWLDGVTDWWNDSQS
jgi:hypothetical protein